MYGTCHVYPAFSALATQDILKTEVNAVTETQATLGLGYSPCLVFLDLWVQKFPCSAHPSTNFFPIFACLCEHPLSQVFLQSRGDLLCGVCLDMIPLGLCLKVMGDPETYRLGARADSRLIARRTMKHNPCPQGIYSVFGEKGYRGRQACKGGNRLGL